MPWQRLHNAMTKTWQCYDKGWQRFDNAMTMLWQRLDNAMTKAFQIHLNSHSNSLITRPIIIDTFTLVVW